MPELAIVRSLGSPRRLHDATELSDFGQELLDQWALSMAAAGCSDGHVQRRLWVVVEFVRFCGGPLWTAGPEDADRYLRWLRTERAQAASTVKDKAWTIARFFDFLLTRYEGDVHALTGA